jgi:hypothetical protein
MLSNSSLRRDSGPSAHKSFVSKVELEGRTKKAIREMYDLLEQYAPSWYPLALHKRVEALLQLLEK